MIVEKTQPLIRYKAYLSKSLQNFVSLNEWTDYQWQLNNSIKTIVDFENFTGIKFSRKRTRRTGENNQKISTKHHTILRFLNRYRKLPKRPHLQTSVPQPRGTKNFQIRHERSLARRQRQPNQRNNTPIPRPRPLLNQQSLRHVL